MNDTEQNMNEAELKPGKLYYTIGEVSKMLGVETSTVRFWENEFSVIKPHRNAKGNRMFTANDVKNLKTIYYLLKERRMTLEGAKQTMRDKRDDTAKETELIERLKKLRYIVTQMRDALPDNNQ
ncbi:MAG: MerR family transcriptional regulator [Bacteroidales bacterium]|nr:MerR family transcriptional regulator [Bacteroidales bacterium]